MKRPGLIKDWFKSWIKSAVEDVSEAWERSAHVLLDRLFENWEPSNQDSNEKFTKLLNSYKLSFLTARDRVAYMNNMPAPTVQVSEIL